MISSEGILYHFIYKGWSSRQSSFYLFSFYC
nr:MAG TPA: hypothetical protein [Caudoviricetes sp.]